VTTAQTRNPDAGPRCGECRMGLGVHNTADPLCEVGQREAQALHRDPSVVAWTETFLSFNGGVQVRYKAGDRVIDSAGQAGEVVGATRRRGDVHRTLVRYDKGGPMILVPTSSLRPVEARAYDVRLPVTVTVHSDGRVEYEVDTTEAGAAIVETSDAGDTDALADAGVVDEDHRRRMSDRALEELRKRLSEED